MKGTRKHPDGRSERAVPPLAPRPTQNFFRDEAIRAIQRSGNCVISTFDDGMEEAVNAAIRQNTPPPTTKIFELAARVLKVCEQVEKGSGVRLADFLVFCDTETGEPVTLADIQTLALYAEREYPE